MTRPKTKTTAAQEEDSKDTATFSVRLTEEQRDVINKAAALRGWKPANLLRVAALEKAAHIINTTTQTKVDFRGLAYEVARTLLAERRCYYAVEGPEAFYKEEATVVDDVMESPENVPPKARVVEVTPRPFRPKELADLSQAAKFGGTEFMNLVVDACEAVVTNRTRGQLPDPVDPGIV